MTKKYEKEKLTSYDLIKANLLLATSKSFLVPITQPIQVIMRHQQSTLNSAKPRSLSFISAYKEIGAGKALPGILASLFKGTAPAVIKEGVKNITYKGALIKGAPNLADLVLPDSLMSSTSPSQYQLIRACVAGGIASFSDATIAGTLESYATYRATSQGNYSNASWLNEFKIKTPLEKIRFLYRGYIPTLVKGGVAFTTFFALTAPIENMTATLYGFRTSKEATAWYCLATSALLSGFSVAMTSSVFDIIKTQSQSPGAKKTNIFSALQTNFKLHGLRAITAGLPAKTLMVTIGWSLNFFATQGSKEKERPDSLQPSSVSKTVG